MRKVKTIWLFPPLSDGKQGRVITKHFTNLAMTLDPNHYALLSFLIHQSLADNTIKYSQRLLLTYAEAVKCAQKLYSAGTELHLSLPKVRANFDYLVSNSLLLPYGKLYVINPSLTFSKLYTNTDFYRGWVLEYQGVQLTDLGGITEKYVTHVNNNYNRRKNKLH